MAFVAQQQSKPKSQQSSLHSNNPQQQTHSIHPSQSPNQPPYNTHPPRSYSTWICSNKNGAYYRCVSVSVRAFAER